MKADLSFRGPPALLQAHAQPMPGTQPEVEIRPVFETEDFAASDPTGELRAQEERLRAQVAGE